MWKYFKALMYVVTGRFSAAADALRSNKYVMGATYDKAIDTSADRFNTVKSAVATLMAQEQTRVQEIKTLQAKEKRLGGIKTGSLAAMKRVQQELLNAGKSKEEIVQNGDFVQHQAAYKDASSSLEEVSARCDEKESDLVDRQAQIATYKAELQRMQRQHQNLKEEKSEAIADVEIAKQMASVNDLLTGIAESSVDKDLAATREARKREVAKSKISSELAGNDARHAENEYLQLAAGSEVDAELDGLLNWDGDAEKAAPMGDARLPE